MSKRKATTPGEIPYIAPPKDKSGELRYAVPKQKKGGDIPYVVPHTKKADSAPMWCVVLYIACIVLGCVGDWSRIAGGIGTYLKAASLGSVALAGYVIIKTGKAKGLKDIVKFAVLFVGPILITLLLSLVIWVVNAESLSAISRGSQKLIFQVVNIISVLAAAYLFKGKIVLYFFIGLIGGNALICVLEIPKYGIGGTIQSLIDGLLGGNTYGFMRAMEIHDITFAAGLFAMYFMTAGWKDKNKIWYGLVAFAFFILGFKRIAIPGCLLAIILWWFIEKRKRRTRIRLIYIVSAGMVLMSFLYVIIIREGVFLAVMDALGVDMMGRQRIYPYLESFYKMDPTFIGYGFEYTVAMLRDMRDSGTQIIHVTGIHNDILKLYIELGFWGFWTWLLYVYVFQTRWYMKHYGERTARLMLIINLYTFITYMTDNTTYYFWLSMAMRAMMIGFAHSGEVIDGLNRERDETGILNDLDIRTLAGDGDTSTA